jgi:glutamate--cysteine ligase
MLAWFGSAARPGGRLIGTEQEKFTLARAEDGTPIPGRWQDHVRPTLERLMTQHGWSPAEDRGTSGEIVALVRDRASITLEPGGQLELSGAPLPTLHQTCAELSTHRRELDEVGEALGVTFLAAGFHPFATREEIDWMPKGRYRVMRDYLPTRGARALDMMLRTSTIQANYDFDDEATCMSRFRVAMATSALFTAIFANSPYHEGTSSGFVSTRSATWEEVDPARCGLLRFAFEATASWEAYVDWLLDVPMFFVKRDGQYHPHHVPFRDFMRDGFTAPDGAHHVADEHDFVLHASTVFPEVRLKPYIEIRGADSVPAQLSCALPALGKGILYDADAADAAWALVAELDFDARNELWSEARRVGFASDRVWTASRRLVRIAREGLARLDERDATGRDETHFLDDLEALVEQRKSPGDLVREQLGDAPGRERDGRLAFARAYHYAGARV